MTWNNLYQRARQLGFEVTCQMGTPAERGLAWQRVGSLDQMPGLWAQPVSESTRNLSSEKVVALIAECSPFVGTMICDDAEFCSALAPLRAAVSNPDYGRMPA